MKLLLSLHQCLLYGAHVSKRSGLFGGANFGKECGPVSRGVPFLPLMKFNAVCLLQQRLAYCALLSRITGLCGGVIFGKECGPVIFGVPFLLLM